MKIAIISDVHSNIEALKAVFMDIDTRQVDRIYSTGDLVGYLTNPNEVIDLMKERKIPCILGNHDQVIASGRRLSVEETLDFDEKTLQANASNIFTNMTITEDNRAYLKNLPNKMTLDIEGVKVLLTHGSPRRIDEYVFQEEALLEELVDSFTEDVVVVGHTHIPYHKVFENKHFVNAGSVGKPKHGNNNSTYIILDIQRNHICVDIIEVAYPLEGLIEAVKTSKYISDKLIPMLLEGR